MLGTAAGSFARYSYNMSLTVPHTVPIHTYMFYLYLPICSYTYCLYCSDTVPQSLIVITVYTVPHTVVILSLYSICSVTVTHHLVVCECIYKPSVRSKQPVALGQLQAEVLDETMLCASLGMSALCIRFATWSVESVQ